MQVVPHLEAEYGPQLVSSIGLHQPVYDDRPPDHQLVCANNDIDDVDYILENLDTVAARPYNPSPMPVSYRPTLQ